MKSLILLLLLLLRSVVATDGSIDGGIFKQALEELGFRIIGRARNPGMQSLFSMLKQYHLRKSRINTLVFFTKFITFP